MKRKLFAGIAAIALFFTLFNIGCINKNQKESEKSATTIITNKRGESIKVTLNKEAEVATVEYGDETIIMEQKPSASGIYYSNDVYEYSSGKEVELSKNGKVIFTNVLEDETITNKLIDEEGKVLTVVYDTSTEIPTATITYEDHKDVTLPQIPGSAWAKGAEYEKDDIKWIFGANGGTLTIGDKSINFAETEN